MAVDRICLIEAPDGTIASKDKCQILTGITFDGIATTPATDTPTFGAGFGKGQFGRGRYGRNPFGKKKFNSGG